ncbi:MAG: wax ester/triacylglycerol synthase domain-containing protein [Ilumatobacteraceae bacterium]
MEHEMPRFDDRMSDAEALMWRVEKDPFLTSTFANITVLDRTIDFEAFVARMNRASIAIPRLRQRVQPTPVASGAPRWVRDPEFNIRHHVRRMALPYPGSMRQLQDLTTLIANDAFDRSRPLWQFVIVEGLEGGQSALIQKLHHTVTDGQGGVALSMQFLDLTRDAAPLPPLPEPDDTSHQSATQAAGEVLSSSFNDVMRTPLALLRQVREVLSDPLGLPAVGTQAAAAVQGLVAELQSVDPARSPLWTQRSLQRQLETLRVPYRDLLDASRALGGKLNTAFLTAAADAAGRYHYEKGSPVESLRTSMAISTRNESSGANAFTLTRMLVPTLQMPITERFAAINEIISVAREQAKAASLDTLATMSALLPTTVLTRIARTQSQTVDFATSNVRGAGVPLYIGGALVLGNYPVGPLGGVAFNLTMLSYNHNLDMGLNVDTAAVTDPELLRKCVEDSMRELINSSRPTTVAVGEKPKFRLRWWKRR